MNHARTVDVGGEIPYTIAIGPGLLGDGDALARHVRGRHVLLVSDSVVAPLYAGTVREALHPTATVRRLPSAIARRLRDSALTRDVLISNMEYVLAKAKA